MKTYFVSCQKYTANENSSVRKTKQNRLLILSSCAICGNRKSTFIKNQEISNDQFKMNLIFDYFLLTGNEYMPELHLKQPVFTYSACEPFTKHRERIQKVR